MDPELVAAALLASVQPVYAALIDLGGPLHPILRCRCWLWTGRLNRSGHARLHWRHSVAHRVVWEDVVGPVPDGLVLDHLCRIRRCVNPLHLEPVTVRVNTLRGEAVLFKPRRIAVVSEVVSETESES